MPQLDAMESTMANPTVEFTEGDLIYALINLVGSLAFKLTGEYPSLRVENKDGQFVGMLLLGENVKWRTSQDILDLADRRSRCRP